ncbi:MAG TPA: phosphate/phosphite/phosphonate ABC transporter substrate-binding protein [Trueperaceae bacterium]|nr:phosphate/phosphite/phosphonate ABC transporter substrate-binding protein [Trueperaceae bacterium]
MKEALVKFSLLVAAIATLFSFAAAQAPITVRIGFNPTQNSDLLTSASEGIANYLESQLGGAVEVQVFIPTDYRGLIEAMGSGNLDFAFFPPDGFVVANSEVGAQVLLKSVRTGNPYYWSAIVVRKDSGIENIGDLEGKSIAWIDPNSAAGYTFPRAELITAGINPDDFFSNQVYAGGHDAAVLAVLNGSVDAAATFANDDQNISGAWTQFLDADQASQITAIFYTRPIPGDTFSVSQQFASEHAALTYQIAAAIATIKAPDNNLLMDLYRIDYMIPADSSDYAVVRDTRRILGLDQ